MNANTVIGITAIGIIALYFWNKSRVADYLNYSISRVSLGFSGITPVLRFDISIQNPSGTSFTIYSMSGTLYAGNIRLGQVSSFDKVIVAANSASSYSLYFHLSLLGLVNAAVGIISDIVAVFNGQGTPQQVEFEGAVNVDSVTVPIDFKTVIG